MQTIDQSSIKENNKKRIVKFLMKVRETTKLDIARTLNISVPTVTTIINELMAEGIASEFGTATSTGGRKPVIIKFVPDVKFSIGVDFGKNYMRAVLTDLDGRIIKDMKQETHDMEGTEIIKSAVQLISKIMDGNSKNKILGIGFSLPGTVDEKNLTLEFAANFKMKDICFKEVQRTFNVPLYLENEANAGALAECNIGTARDLKNLVYVSITEGIGGGIIINQNMYKGKSNRAGEIGHMTINKNGRLCGCGKRGCWETYASARAFINDYNENADEPVLCIDEIVKRYKDGEKYAQKIVEQYIDNLAEGIQNLIFILNPEYIVIGGEISRFKDVFHGMLKKKIFDNNAFYEDGDVDILFSKLGKDSNVIGAALIPVLETYGYEKV